MRVLKSFKILFTFLASPRMIWSALTYKVFSITSYNMLHIIKDEGINPQVIIDVGANKGQFAIASAHIFPRCKIFSFEPDPDTYYQLVENASAHKNIVCFQTALGDTSGEIEFNRNRYSLSSSILSMTSEHLQAFPKATEKEIITVPLTTLDALAPQLELTKQALLKLDVQGYEKLVIDGARKTLANIEFVALEASFRPLYEGEMSFSDCVINMRELGFEIITPISHLQDPKTAKILQIDLLFKNMRKG